MNLYGVSVADEDYEVTKRLAEILFLQTPSDSTDGDARRLAVQHAIRCLKAIRQEGMGLPFSGKRRA
jgi:hypothetical protein